MLHQGDWICALGSFPMSRERPLGHMDPELDRRLGWQPTFHHPTSASQSQVRLVFPFSQHALLQGG